MFVLDSVYPTNYKYTTTTPSVTFKRGETRSSLFRVTTVDNTVWKGLTNFEIGMAFHQDVGFTLKAIEPETIKVTISDDDCKLLWGAHYRLCKPSLY